MPCSGLDEFVSAAFEQDRSLWAYATTLDSSVCLALYCHQLTRTHDQSTICTTVPEATPVHVSNWHVATSQQGDSSALVKVEES